jgi:hypothetical protein
MHLVSTTHFQFDDEIIVLAAEIRTRMAKQA